MKILYGNDMNYSMLWQAKLQRLQALNESKIHSRAQKKMKKNLQKVSMARIDYGRKFLELLDIHRCEPEAYYGIIYDLARCSKYGLNDLRQTFYFVGILVKAIVMAPNSLKLTDLIETADDLCVSTMSQAQLKKYIIENI